MATTIKILGDLSFDGFVDISDRLVVYGDASFTLSCSDFDYLVATKRFIMIKYTGGNLIFQFSVNNKMGLSSNFLHLHHKKSRKIVYPMILKDH